MVHFDKFSRLPSELRDQIWLAAIPRLDDPAVFVYHAACCRMTRKVCHDELPEHILHFDYYFDVFSAVRSLDSLLAASSESRNATIRWLNTQESIKWLGQTDGGRWIARPFDPELDILYIPLNCVHYFGTQLVDLLFQPENYDQRIGENRTHIRRLAIPYAAFRNRDYEILAEIAEFIEDLEVLYVVANHDDIDGVDAGVGEQYPRTRWELHGHSYTETEAENIEASVTAKMTVAQRGAAGFSSILDYLEEHGRLPYDLCLTDVARVRNASRTKK